MGVFEDLTGITAETPAAVYDALSMEGTTLTSKLTGWRAETGHLSVPSLADLRTDAPGSGALTVEEVIADVQGLHMQAENAGATFQVASQFNLLEMVSPSVTPEMGVARYATDRTQGPACALACLAGTIYRNYFLPLKGGIGQTAQRQVDCLAKIASLLGGDQRFLWEMRNGYALPTDDSLHAINQTLAEMDVDHIRAALRIGVQKDTQVTTNDAGRLVTQAYCSAMPVAYSGVSADLWAPLAKLILEAAYEATLLTARQNAARSGNNRLFLTMLGGGAFGNHPDWIIAAILRALDLHADSGLEVSLVSYGQSSAIARHVVASFDW